MQQRKPTPEDFINQDTQEYERPHQERMPKTLSRQPEPDRFEDEQQPEWFWIFAFWAIMAVIILMGGSALIDMYKSSYSWLLALSWTSTAVCGAGGLALIQKYWLRR